MFRRAANRSNILPLMAGLLAASVLPAFAAAAETVQVQIWVIRATTSNKKVSPELKSLAGKLKKDFKYTGYKLESKTGGAVALAKSKRFSLTGPYSAVVTPAAGGARITLKLDLYQKSGKTTKKKFSTTMKISRGKSQLLGRWPLGKGDVLILAVSVK